MTEHSRVKTEIKDGIAVLTLNHPEAMNAVSLAMLRGLDAALKEIEAPDSGARVLIITGAGRGFCAGANLTDSERGSVGQGDAGYVLEAYYHPLFFRLRDLKMPIITAVNGAAAGVGMSLALSGDLCVAAKSASFLQAFTRIGLIPDGGSTYLLPRLIGKARTAELVLLAEKLPAEKAVEWGLIYSAVDDDKLMETAMGLATKLAAGPTLAYAMARKALAASPDQTYERQLDMERQLQRVAGASEDFKEGVKAFVEKRPAKFQGR
ncbi:enoyl-CoA hydratase/isomerase [Zavarzinia sp. CC-PAN008]|uniref:enoyl-CoA hydratase/isomerase n=1 Tax=Zavarzinia sp. CC-PAN008 TaxID=3243332 RepID=UPI003F7420A8